MDSSLRNLQLAVGHFSVSITIATISEPSLSDLTLEQQEARIIERLQDRISSLTAEQSAVHATLAADDNPIERSPEDNLHRQLLSTSSHYRQALSEYQETDNKERELRLRLLDAQIHHQQESLAEYQFANRHLIARLSAARSRLASQAPSQFVRRSPRITLTSLHPRQPERDPSQHQNGTSHSQ